MSEYQVVAFRALDRPVSTKNLEYMQQQSSRAEITPWSFDNEYHYGDFGGDAHEMLRRGYDLHLHYANFGTRTLLLRLPNGLPDSEAAKPYLTEDLVFQKDKQGPGGILCIDPCHESDDLDQIDDFDGLLVRLAPLRAEISDGDLRPLYLAHLVMASDTNHDPEETLEAPVPAGLSELTDAQRALVELYELDDMVAAAARDNPPLTPREDVSQQHRTWLQAQPQADKDAWLAQWLADPQSTARSDMLAAFRRDRPAPVWPTVARKRTIAELQAAAKIVHEEAARQAKAKAARQRAKRLADMAADPQPTLRETEKLAQARSRGAYEKIAEHLKELREALAGTPQAGLAEEQARKLKAKHPTLRTLVSALRHVGFLPK